MIISCPQCDVRFVIPSTVFMNGGRKMRCASCKHVWMQDEPLEKSSSSNIEDAPEKSKKDKQGKLDQSVSQMLKTDIKDGKISILIGFIIILSAFFIYKFMTPSMIIGQGIAFNNMVVEQGDDGKMIVKGEIVNTMDDVRGIPSIKITNLMADNVEGDSVIFKTDKQVLKSGETHPIHYEVDNIDHNIFNLKVMFYIAGHENKPIEHEIEHDKKVEKSNIDAHHPTKKVRH